MMNKIIQKSLISLMMAFFVGGILFSPGDVVLAEDIVNCSDTVTTGIPQVECDTLVVLYNETDGENWRDNTNWLKKGVAVANWYGIRVADSRVSVLRLDGNKLKDHIPEELGNLSELKELSLENNMLEGEIPTELMELSKVQYFGLRHNELTGEIPTNINHLKSVGFLTLAENQLTGNIPESLGDLKINHVHLADNKLTGNIYSSFRNFNRILVANNQLSGKLPDLGDHYNNSNGYLDVRGNKFSFADREETYQKVLSSGNDKYHFYFTPQREVDSVRTVEMKVGDALAIVPELAENSLGHDFYQWYRNGLRIEGATARVYKKENISGNEQGLYSYVVKNSVMEEDALVSHNEGEGITVVVEGGSEDNGEDLSCVDWDGDGWGWDGEKGCRMDGEEFEDTDKPSCKIYTNTVSTEEKGITLHWYYNGGITKAMVEGVGEVTNGENWKWLEYSGATDFTMTVENNEGETATCRVEIEYANDEDLIG